MSSYVLPVLLSGSVAPSSGDFFAPVITNVSSGTPTDTGATITWTTDENSNSQVVYGATSAYGSSTTLHAVSVTSHSEAITGLTASTSYHYAVKSADAAGNLATSGDNTFTTAAGSSVNLTSGIIHYWNFNEASGSWADSVGSATVGVSSSPTHTAGLISNALDGNTEAGFGAISGGLDLHGSVTIAGWVKGSGLNAAGDIPFVTQGDAAFSVLDFYIYYGDGPPQQWVFQCGAAGADYVTIAGAADITGTVWNFVCARYDLATTTLRLRVNTTDSTPLTTSGGLVHNSGSADLNFGALIYNSTYYLLRGKIDEVGIWNRSLTDAEVTTLYNSGTGITYPFT